nr:DNA helicase [Tanacetum cinerariifolium]
MRTKRKLIPKSNISSSAGSGQHNVVGHSGYDNVCNVDSGVPLKKQCVRQLSSVSCRVPESGVSPSVFSNTQCVGHLNSLPYNDEGLEVYGLPDVALSVPQNRRCIRQLKSGSCRVRGSSTSEIPFNDELLLQSTRHDNVNTHSDASGELCHYAHHVADANAFPKTSSWEPPRFLQLYIYDTDNEIDNRMNHFGGDSSALRRDIVEGLIELLDGHNALVQLFRTARDMLGAIVYEPGLETDMDYDIIIEERSGYPQRVNKLHPSYMSLQFPLLFIYGRDGYSKKLRMVSPTGSSSEQKRVSMLAYYSYYLHDRANQYNYLSRTGRLFQQYVVAAFCAIELNHIDYVRENQNDIRNEYLSGIYDAINHGYSEGSDCGSRLILPQSFTVLYTVEFQKRGLPHCHTLLWIEESAQVRKEEDIDVYISAELPLEDRVIFKERDRLDSVVLNTHKKKTTFTEWLHYNEHNTDGRHLTYLNFSSEFVWYVDGKYWHRRHIRTKSLIGRLSYVHPAAGDLFYQRMLLCHQKGCRSFPAIRTINDVFCPTCRATCEALGLLEDDREWEITLKEAALSAMPTELRTLLAHILAFCQISDPVRLWNHTWKSMSKDIPYTSSISLNILDLHIDDSDLEDYMLYELEGKTFLWKTIIFTLRSEGKIVLAVASLDVGNGNIGTPDESDPENSSWIHIPDQYRIPDDENEISNLINFIYDDETLRYPSAVKLQDKAIVCLTNDTADAINAKIMSLLSGTTHTYISYDDAIPHGHDGREVELLYPREYLNTLSFSGLPPHRLELKVGTPIMLLRNVNIVGGICNGTHLIVTQLLRKRLLSATITLSNKAEDPILS